MSLANCPSSPTRSAPGELERYIRALRELRHQLGEDLFDEVVQAGWIDDGRPERVGHCLVEDFALF